ncbi:right-handed parallel beta-helix repeat-containing protein [Psychroserpens algicola]|uniref:right-handed parallel beta-helix repeat-containing protein n=1 Tax=Psychroserpens algicola TaxID=1719034 RepID=UPI00195368EB|nr:right-handed parallel beta-helix repeat-containing protein [Psychroserpens algicola]
MKQYLIYIICCILGFYANAQEEFHVFSKNDAKTPGSERGDGSLKAPWDLQTALSQTPEVVKPGAVIWLHEGIYNGRFISTLKSLEPNTYVTVSGYKNDKVVLNGNVTSDRDVVLDVKGKQVIFKDFDVTWLGDFSRNETDSNFETSVGIRHLSGENCKFYNLKIYNIPGLGFGSWKHAAGSVIENCMIYNNGYIAKDGKGRGEGIYVQNKSDEVRLIKRNIIFNNYYKGIEVWSAGKNADFQYVKHITLEDNIIFNSGSPSGRFLDNVIVASNDRNGINVASNISVINNVLYHNTQQDNGRIIGDAPALTLGFHKNAPIEDVVVDGNIIVGGYNGLRILEAKTLQFTNNIVHTGIVQIGPTVSNHFRGWNSNGNVIYSRLKQPFRIPKVKDHSLESWTSNFNLDKQSQLIAITNFNLDPVVHLSQHSQHKNKYNLALFNAEGNAVTVDFSAYDIAANSGFKLYDVENPEVVLKSGKLSEDLKISVPMKLTKIEKPRHNTKAKKTLSNFGVFMVEFDVEQVEISEDKKKDNAIKRFFKWLGF